MRTLRRSFVNLPIRTRLSLGYGIVVAVAIISVVVGLVAQVLVDQEISRTTTVSATLNELTDDIESNLSASQTSLNQYVVQRVLVGSADEALSIEAMNALADIHHNIDDLRVVAAGQGSERFLTLVDKLDLLESDLTMLESGVVRIVDDLHILGDEESGQQKDFLDSLSRLDQAAQDSGVLEIQLAASNAFSEARGFLVDGRPAHIGRFKSDIARLKALALNAEALTELDQSRLNDMADSALADFDNFALLRLDFDARYNAFLNQAARIRLTVGEIRDIGHAEFDQSIAATKAAQQVARGARTVMLVLLVALIPMSIALVLVVNRSITHPLAELTGATRKLSAGDLSARSRIKRLDEIGELADSFNHMADALETSMRESRQSGMLAAALADTASMLTNTLNLDEVLNNILAHASRVFPHEAANILLLDRASQTLRRARGKGYGDLDRSKEVSVHHIDDMPILREIIDSGKLIVIPDTHSYPGWVDVPGNPAIRSYVGVPIKLNERVIGILNLDGPTPGFFAGSQTESLEAFAAQAAIAIQNARLFEELEAYSERLKAAVAERTTQLNSTTERVEAILDNSPDAILLLDSKARIDTANPAFYRVFNTPAESYRRQPVHDLVTVDGKEKVQDAVHLVAVKRKTIRLEVTARRPDDTTFPVDMALAAIRQNGSAVGIVCIVRDITESKEVEAMKDRFVSNVSHELRTPIASLKLNQQLLRDNPERSDVYLGRLGREIDRLNVLVEDILRLSRLDQAKIELQLEPIDLNELVAQHVDDRTPIAESRSIELSAIKAENLPLAQADSTLLGQALSVLLTNAMNYTPAGGKIIVSTKRRRDGTRALVGFEVRDTGPGVPPEERAQLSTRFFRGKVGRDSGMPGTGLGLSIASEIVQRHGGTIEVGDNKEAGSGAVFSVWLPAR